MANEKALETKVEIELGGEKVMVEKLALGRYAQLIFALKSMPTDALKDLQAIDTENEEDTIQSLIGMVGSSWGSILEIIAIGSGIDKDKIENDPAIGLDGGIALFIAIYEVNNLASVFKQVKNAFSRLKA